MTVRQRKALTGQGIRAARVRLGLTQQQLAAALGVSSRAVGRWENGGRVESEEMLRLALERLQCPGAWVEARQTARKAP